MGIKEMFVFFSRTFAKNVKPGQRTSVKHEAFLCHMYCSPGGITACCFADAEYPSRVAFGYLSKLCEDFTQTKVVLHDTIEAALERGQKIDTLIEKSNDLSGSSKMFYKTAKRQNQCCCSPGGITAVCF